MAVQWNFNCTSEKDLPKNTRVDFNEGYMR